MHKYFTANKNTQLMFTEFFSFYLEKFDKKIESNNVNITNVNLNGVYNYIYICLFNHFIRTLIKELHTYKNENLLNGQTSEERFCSFETLISSKKFIESFYDKYPLLKEYSEKKINQLAEYITEIISNLNKDKNIIENTFGFNCEKILNIKLGTGDTHNNGKSVTILEFPSGKIVYKPHDLSSDIIFNNIVNWVNNKNKLKINLNSLKVINYTDYGWQQFVDYNECINITSIQNYYYRAGCFLGLFYSLGTSDIHYENLVVDGEYPYFIDLETLFSINNSGQIDTVLTTSFIPNKFSNSLFDMDLSGLCGCTSTSNKIKGISIINPRTDEMKISTDNAKIVSNTNLVKLNNKIQKIDNYSNYFINGFSDFIDLILDDKQLYLDYILENLNGTEKFRQVIRFTHVYAKFLLAATHPDYISCEEQRLKLFKKLYNGCNNDLDRIRITNEIHSLTNWDVPYYYCYFNSKNLFSNNNLICENFFKSTIKDSLCERINLLNNNIKDFQIDVIKKSLFTVYDDKFIKNQVKSISINTDYSKKNNNDLILEITNSISKNVLEIDNDDKVAFLINIFENESAFLSSINFNLYEGGGIIWLFACIGKLYNKPHYTKLSQKLLESSIALYDYSNSKQNNSPERISAFSGIGSLIYLHYNLYKLTGETKFKEKFINNCERVLNLNLDYLNNIDESINYDFLCGISGFIVLMCKIYLKENTSLIKKIINKYSKYLLTYIHNTNINKLGLAHGISGYSLALIMLYKVEKDETYLSLCKTLLDKEDIIYLSEKNPQKTSWCNGETGMLLPRCEFLKLSHDKKILSITLGYFKTVCTNGLYNINNMCLCHGIYGNIEIINKTLNDIKESNNIITSNDLVSFESKLLFKLSDINLGLKNNFIIDTFMIGSSGIAYSKLQNKFNILPSVICLDIL